MNMRRLRRWGIGAGVVAVCAAGALAWGYWELNPQRHFERLELPVLANGSGGGGFSTSVLIRNVSGGVAAAAGIAPAPAAAPSPGPTSASADAAQSAADTAAPKSIQTLLLGVDAREGNTGRTDVMILAQIIPSQRKVNLLSIPRDTRVHIPGVGYTKINHAYVVGQNKKNGSGVQETVEAVSRLTGLPIHYYAKTDFSGFEQLIDEIGGVDIELDQDIYLTHHEQTIRKGTVHFDGKLALSLVRERYSFAAGDFARQAQQTRVLKIVARELLQPSHATELAKLLIRARKGLVETSFSDKDLLSLALLFKGLEDDDIRTEQIPGYSGYADDPLVGKSLYYWYADEKKLQAIIREMSVR